jgi:hypothetical protein
MNQPTVGYLFFFAMSIHQSTSWYNTFEKIQWNQKEKKEKLFDLGFKATI